jgi:hypothetical protein
MNENLITLCHTCHKGLEPHEDWALFELIGAGFGKFEATSVKREYDEGVRLYREQAAKVFADLLGHVARGTATKKQSTSAKRAKRDEA